MKFYNCFRYGLLLEKLFESEKMHKEIFRKKRPKCKKIRKCVKNRIKETNVLNLRACAKHKT